MRKKLITPPINPISVAFETNSEGYLGFIAELPGVFIRGKTEEEALSKVKQEVKSYLKWLGIEEKLAYDTNVGQRHQSALMVEDADCEILLNADKGTMSEEEFKNLKAVTKALTIGLSA